MKHKNMEKIVVELFNLLHRVHRCRVKFQKQGDMANVEYFILVAVAVVTQRRPEGVTMKELADMSHTTMSAASKKIRILEEKGLIERRTSKTDRRNSYITLSENGKAICEKERRRKNDWLLKVISQMGEEDMEQLITLSNRMFDIMETLEAEDSVEKSEGE